MNPLRELREDVEYYASPHMVRELQEHTAWRDVVAYLEDHIIWCYQQLEEVNTVAEMKLIQGHIQLARAVLGLPEQLIELAEEETDGDT